MHEAILSQYRYCIVTTSPRLIETMSWRYLHKGIPYRHHFDVSTMTMIFSKKIQFFTISILRRRDIAMTYCDDIVTISSQKEYLIDIISMFLLWRWFSQKIQFFTISILRHHDIATTYCDDVVMISSQKGISYRHHFDVSTMIIIFSKKFNFHNINIASSRYRHNLLRRCRDDIFTKEYLINIILMLLLWR